MNQLANRLNLNPDYEFTAFGTMIGSMEQIATQVLRGRELTPLEQDKINHLLLALQEDDELYAVWLDVTLEVGRILIEDEKLSGEEKRYCDDCASKLYLRGALEHIAPTEILDLSERKLRDMYHLRIPNVEENNCVNEAILIRLRCMIHSAEKTLLETERVRIVRPEAR